jgi:hypothetical protein
LLLQGLKLWAALQGCDGLLLYSWSAKTKQSLLLCECACACLCVGLQELLDGVKLSALFVNAALGCLLLGL